MRSRKGRPDVHIELMRAEDGEWKSISNALRLEYSKTPVSAIRINVGKETWWSLDIDRAETARASLIADIRHQAEGLGVAFDALCAALRSRLLWTEDQCLALAIAFAFPSPIRWDRARFRVIRTGRGRPPVLDATWQEVVRLARAWAAVTGTTPGIGPNALFVAALQAAVPHLPTFGARGQASTNIRKLLERERSKFRNQTVEWLFPAPEAQLTLSNFTTSKPKKN